jgi:hypothetical protein
VPTARRWSTAVLAGTIPPFRKIVPPLTDTLTMFQPATDPVSGPSFQSVCQMNVHATYTYPYGKRHLLRSGYRAIRFPHQNMGTAPSAIRDEINRPHPGKEVVLGSCVDGADFMENTMEGHEAFAAPTRGDNLVR